MFGLVYLWFFAFLFSAPYGIWIFLLRWFFFSLCVLLLFYFNWMVCHRNVPISALSNKCIYSVTFRLALNRKRFVSIFWFAWFEFHVVKRQKSKCYSSLKWKEWPIVSRLYSKFNSSGGRNSHPSSKDNEIKLKKKLITHLRWLIAHSCSFRIFDRWKFHRFIWNESQRSHN